MQKLNVFMLKKLNIKFGKKCDKQDCCDARWLLKSEPC